MRCWQVHRRLAFITCQALTKELTMNAKTTIATAGIVVSTGIVAGPKRIFIGSLS